MVAYGPGDPRLPDEQTNFSHYMLAHSPLSSVAGKERLETMRRNASPSPEHRFTATSGSWGENPRSPARGYMKRSASSSAAWPSASGPLSARGDQRSARGDNQRSPAERSPDQGAGGGQSPTFKAGTQGGVGGHGKMHRTPTMMTLSPTRPTLAMSTPAQRDVMPTPDSGGRRGDGVTRQTLARANGLAVDEARLGFAAAADAGTMRPLTAANAVKQQQQRNDAQPGMVWSQDFRSSSHAFGGGAPGWRVLTGPERVLRSAGGLSRAGL